MESILWMGKLILVRRVRQQRKNVGGERRCSRKLYSIITDKKQAVPP